MRCCQGYADDLNATKVIPTIDVLKQRVAAHERVLCVKRQSELLESEECNRREGFESSARVL